MKNNIRFSAYGLTALAIAASLTLAACGGGGGGGSAGSSGAAGSATPASGTSASTPTPASAPVPGTLATPQYPASSAQLAALTQINQYRQECGFPVLQENSILDQVAQNHAAYQAQNNLVTDTEVRGNPDFTGVTAADRAQALGWPSGVYAGSADDGVDFTTTKDATLIGTDSLMNFMANPYHSTVVPFLMSDIGFGFSAGRYATFASFTIGGNAPALTGSPLTFPCQGVTGVPYEGTGETPTAAGVAGPTGSPVVVTANLTDVMHLTAGTMTDPQGNRIALSLLDSSSDSNKLVGTYEGVAFPTAPLLPNTQYSVVITGTVNGTAFSRPFTFTTGNVVG